MSGPERVSRLKWLCRRGMRELDILLGNFIDRNQTALLRGDWPELEGLLQTEDDVLWDWLQDPASGDELFRELLVRINRGQG